ncbi:auxin-responsive protein IAA26-like isoform X2 [Euphorbia lathyris]|uniref:auxin-responsive protein IAA26-like isoform X2 n=1 Tax=Euphorbia lathyris TaxID=212925 RepID=UPI00331347AF
MEGSSKSPEVCPQLLDLIPREREFVAKRGEESEKTTSDEKKLELRLGLPGHESNNGDESHLITTLQYFHWYNQQQGKGTVSSPFLKFKTNNIATTSQQTLPVIAKESSSPCCTKVVVDLHQPAEKKVFSPPTAVPNTSQKRTAPGPVVGWPPIRSFRKNLASSSSSKSAIDSQNESPKKKVASETAVETTCKRGMFVKINMDGVPIGRKVDLKAYDSYEKLSSAVDELFRDLLAAQRDMTSGGIMRKEEEEGKAITGVLDGSGEYTLVYEDNEGDRMLVGDVPWHMFVSTVKRLRVLKSSEVSALTFGNNNKNDKCC